MISSLTWDASPYRTFQNFVSLIKSPYFFCVWFVAAASSFFFVDEPLAFYMHSLQGTVWVTIAGYVTELGFGTYYIMGFLLLFLSAKFLFRHRQITIISFFLFLSVTVPGIICDILKIILGRSRPTELFHHHLYGFHFLQTKVDMWSFPSGHATTITGLMIALSFLWPRLWWLFGLMAIMVSVSRIIVTAHFLSDIMAGMYLGAIVVIWIQGRLLFLIDKS